VDDLPDGAVRLPLYGKYAERSPYAILDAADAAWANQWQWMVRPNGGSRSPLNVMRSFNQPPDGKRVLLLLQRALLTLPLGDPGVVLFRNGNPLDLRRANLLYQPRGAGGGTVDLTTRVVERLGPRALYTEPPPRGPDAVNDLARRLGVRQRDVLALSADNDPFLAGRPSHLIQARWFAALWQQFEYTHGVHLRRVHYRLVSQPDPRLWDGSEYLNIEEHWQMLCSAGRYARYLHYIPADTFEDHRNPDPIQYATGQVTDLPWWHIDRLESWTLPSIATDLMADFELPVPGITVYGYDYSDVDQPYHLEMWIEKSTMDDVLDPLCRRYHANFIRGVRYLSITAVVGLLQRIAQRDKPSRILYLSDLDTAGDTMPLQVSRQIEFWLRDYCPGADIKLLPVALTTEQKTHYDLPPSPAKEGTKGLDRFEALHGKGAVELDALEALHPGELARIVEAALAPYYDADLAYRLSVAESEAQQDAEAAWDEATAEAEAELDDLESEIQEIVGRYEERLQALDTELQEDLAPTRQRMEQVWLAIRDRLAGFTLDLPDRPEPEVEPPDESDYLFDSERSYLEQLAYYRARKHGTGSNGTDGSAEEDDDGAA
jgi:hypothetical protein